MTQYMQGIKKLLVSENTFATTLVAVAADKFGPEFLEWDPETILISMNDEFDVRLPNNNYNKLMAAIQIVTSDNFYVDLPTFIWCCNALDHGYVSPGVWDPADAGEVAWGITEALLLWPPDNTDEDPFSDDIAGYIKQALLDEGIMLPPDILKIGIPDADLWGKVQDTYSDDPAMFSAIYSIEHDKTDEINNMVKSRLKAMLQQLDALQLGGQGTGNVVKGLLTTLAKT